MSHFYGMLQGSRGEATRCGTKASGMQVVAAGWGGCVRVYAWLDRATDKDMYSVTLGPWQGGGGWSRELARGELRAPDKSGGMTLNDSAAEHKRALDALRELLKAYMGATGAYGAHCAHEARAILGLEGVEA